jgi:hypothetical protein
MSSKNVTLVKWVAILGISAFVIFVIQIAIWTSGNLTQMLAILTYLVVAMIMWLPWLLVMLILFMVPAWCIVLLIRNARKRNSK